MEKGSEVKKTDEASSSSPHSTIRLLLHAVDGLVPYLTPQLLQACFPAERTGNRLWMGLAVKDTCVVPTFATEEDAEKNHPRGYQFTDTDIQVDAWMQPYTRVTVPTFDMVADAGQRQHAKDAAVAATDQHVMLWTGNGRQPITPEQYFSSAQCLDSAWTVPLFDAGGVGPLKKKRWIAAQKRTQDWSMDYVKRSIATANGTLFPILVNTDGGNSGTEDQLNSLLEINNDRRHGPMGVVLIGWSKLKDELQRESLRQTKSSLNEATVAVLSTDSLAQIIRAACHGATLIGSSLPQQWALQKKSFMLDLDECWNKDDNTEPSAKRPKTNNLYSCDENACLDLHPSSDRVEEHHWYRDKRPIMSNCTCHTCQIHSRAYIYHLVCAKEMLGEVLLFIHNLHHLLEVLRSIEGAIVSPEKHEALLAYVNTLSKGSRDV